MFDAEKIDLVALTPEEDAVLLYRRRRCLVRHRPRADVIAREGPQLRGIRVGWPDAQRLPRDRWTPVADRYRVPIWPARSAEHRADRAARRTGPSLRRRPNKDAVVTANADDSFARPRNPRKAEKRRGCPHVDRNQGSGASALLGGIGRQGADRRRSPVGR